MNDDAFLEVRSFTVDKAHAGQRLDKFLQTVADGITRQRLQAYINDGHVQSDSGLAIRASAKVREGDAVTLRIPAPVDTTIRPEMLALDIVYEDAHVLVINKAAGMVVHPAHGHANGTLVNALLHHCKDSLSGIGGVMRPGIVHRLDKDTSGLMLVAKHDEAHQHLSAQLQDRSLSRTYHAWCWSSMQPPQGTLDLPIARSTQDRKKMAVVQGGRESVTHYRTLAHYSHIGKGGQLQIIASKLECRLQTGRTHQIRVHCAHNGCGLIGDSTYGMATSRKVSQYKLDGSLSDILLTLNQQALHACAIRFIHPKSGEVMQFDAAPPPELQQLETALETLS